MLTWWHIILIGGSALIVAAIAFVRWLAPYTAADPDDSDTQTAPESESDRRFTTTLTRGRDTFTL